MNIIQEHTTALTAINSLGLVGLAGIGYVKIDELTKSIEKLHDAIQTLNKEGTVQKKTTSSFTNLTRELNNAVIQTKATVETIKNDLGAVASALSENNIEIKRPQQFPLYQQQQYSPQQHQQQYPPQHQQQYPPQQKYPPQQQQQQFPLSTSSSVPDESDDVLALLG